MSDADLPFSASEPLTLGVELELQLVSNRDYDLTRGATDLIAELNDGGTHGDVKLELTESMIEVSTRPRRSVAGIAEDLAALRNLVVVHCTRNNIALAGGGTHPFHRWPERRICPGARFERLHERYGYLAKQFTVFGQHIHIGCASGDDALWLTHALQTYVPHFVALSASSPFQEATDTAFASSRLNAVAAFPLSGTAPPLLTWAEFVAFFAMLRDCGVAESIKDLYWDIRPKPEYGTVELRVCDTPLSVPRAVALTAFAQCLASQLLRTRPPVDPQRLSHVARYNKFQACRYGLDGVIADPATRSRMAIREHLLATLDALGEEADRLECKGEIAALAEAAVGGRNGAAWLRQRYEQLGSYNDVTRAAASMFSTASDPLCP
jgi:glutamate---cysteine ligase / carboxylate-amine ligase